jgi:hypothetical protein
MGGPRTGRASQPKQAVTRDDHPSPGSDPTAQALATLFREHPAWIRAARHLASRAESAVFFAHLPGRHWRLVRRRGHTLLIEGRAHHPDFAFRFTPAAVERLAAVQGDDVGDFAVELFACILEDREAQRIDFRIVAPFATLVRRGYVRLLLAVGPKIVVFGAARGVRTLGELRRLVARMRGQPAAAWEHAQPPDGGSSGA